MAATIAQKLKKGKLLLESEFAYLDGRIAAKAAAARGIAARHRGEGGPPPGPHVLELNESIGCTHAAGLARWACSSTVDLHRQSRRAAVGDAPLRLQIRPAAVGGDASIVQRLGECATRAYLDRRRDHHDARARRSRWRCGKEGLCVATLAEKVLVEDNASDPPPDGASNEPTPRLHRAASVRRGHLITERGGNWGEVGVGAPVLRQGLTLTSRRTRGTPRRAPPCRRRTSSRYTSPAAPGGSLWAAQPSIRCCASTPPRPSDASAPARAAAHARAARRDAP